MANILWLRETKRDNTSSVGEKFALLGEVSRLVLIPNGFTLTNKRGTSKYV